jgi:hypothetical protein
VKEDGVVITELQTAYTGLTTAIGMIRGASQMNTDVKLMTQAFELTRHLLDAQRAITSAESAALQLTKEKRELEEEITRLTTWNGEKERYVLAQVGESGFALAVKEEQGLSEPPHYICANCAHQTVKVILNCVQDDEQWTHFHCGRCNTKIATGMMGPVQAKYAP